ncbi:probable 2-oxoglutarate-dependent dioxygenase At5g05600 [Cucurbita maxima]|uniref:Probable 2-oxoglutarate-dependent dioxygenase At5g05600 n=1 Tax=Cucurbita maxima TaxID=3661 RepID=A0A6J1J756_CUCMA|nr:probable 2-oxoglutarate-dependent dioxygenase At5g05600 [Cucurbita maxima]
MSWPEPVVCVQSLAESGIKTIPVRYVKPPCQRPGGAAMESVEVQRNIPMVDMAKLESAAAVRDMAEACQEWGFFHVINHGISGELMECVKESWKQFFDQPLDLKKQYANSPMTYEGYGSRLGIEKGAILDWSDYFFLNYMPTSLRNPAMWPAFPPSSKKLIEEYGSEVVKLCGKLMKRLSVGLGLKEEYLLNAFGGEEGIGACMRANMYPKCPQPDLTLGLSPHSDPGGMTILLPDHNVPGLQVRKGDNWITIDPIPNALIVNIGDQIQVLSNAIYKSVKHRVIVNSNKDRVSLAFFYNPKSDLIIEPAKELVTEERPALFPRMTFDEYRLHIRKRGICGTSQHEQSLKST